MRVFTRASLILACTFIFSLSHSYGQSNSGIEEETFHTIRGVKENAIYLIINKNGDYKAHGSLVGNKLPISDLAAGVYYIKTLGSHNRNQTFTYIKPRVNSK